MTAVNEWIVKEYFEMLGFLVHQPRKYAVASRAKRAEEEIDLLVVNPKFVRGKPPSTMIWRSEYFRHIERGLVGVRGWHTDRFTPRVLSLAPEIVRFASVDVVRQANRVLGPGPVTKILCVPDLPASPGLKQEALVYLKDKGVNGIVLFRTMLSELIRLVETNRSYEKSDLLQILRILKNYDLLKDDQLELFRKRRKK